MITLTKEEKANRYDALMVAIKVTREAYDRRRHNADQSYKEAKECGIIGAYQKGQSDAYGVILDDLSRWDGES